MADFGYVITANEDIEGIYIGTEAEANAICRQFCADYQRKQQEAYGDLAPHLSRTIHWQARKVKVIVP